MSSEESSGDEESSNYNRRRKRFTKEDAMLGIFNDREEEVEVKPIRNVLDPLSFVKAGEQKVEVEDFEEDVGEDVVEEEQEDRDLEGAGEEEEEALDEFEEEEQVHTGLGLGSQANYRSMSLGGSIGRKPKNKKIKRAIQVVELEEEERIVEAQKPKYEPVTLSEGEKKKVGKFLVGSMKDKILNMMAKSGYKPGQGLGVQKQGIIEPITASGQTVKEGLGYGNQTYTPNQTKQANLTDEEESEGEDTVNFISLKVKKKVKRPKTVYKGIHELENKVLNRVNDSTVKQKILDMRGAQPKLLDSVEEVEKSNNAEDVSSTRLDLRLLIDLLYDETNRLESEKQANINQRDHNSIDRQALLPYVELGELELRRLQELESMADRLQHMAQENTLNIPVDLNGLRGCLNEVQDKVVEYLSDVEKDSSSVFLIERLVELAVATVAPSVQLILEDWVVEDSPLILLDFFRLYPNLFFPSTKSPLNTSLGELGNVDYVVQDFSPFDKLVSTYWVPKLRHFLVNSWDPSHYDKVILLVEQWSPSLHPITYDGLIEQCVFPRLKAKLSSWDSRKDVNSPHLYLHPWLPILNEKFDLLVDEIQITLYQQCRNYDVLNANLPPIEQYITPWHRILPQKSIDKILVKGLLPNLESKLRYVEIDPAQQELDLLDRILKFQNTVPKREFVQMVVSVLEPKWKHVLNLWLESDPPLDEITSWYHFWKETLKDSVLKEEVGRQWFLNGLIQLNLYLDLKELEE